jgi:hypothetical protein
MTTTSTNPFALTDADKEFSCDDWAWQFLRLNSRYQEAFSAACDEAGGPRGPSPGPAPSRFFVDRHSVSLADGKISSRECANEFSLAAFLDPAHKTLPPLKEEFSWFFPLTESKHAYVRDEHDRNPTWEPLESDLYLKQFRTPFGYRIPPLTDDVKLLNPGPHAPCHICVPIDCSVSPDAQLRSLDMVAKSVRTTLRSIGRVTARDQAKLSGWRVTNIADSDALSKNALATYPDASSTSGVPSTRWKAVSIDVLAPVERQIQACKQDLLAAQQRHHQSLDDPLWLLRFPSSIRQCPEPDYNYLKTLLSIARHPATGSFDGDPSLADEIVRGVGIRPASRTCPPWLEYFLSAAPLHVRRAQALINGDHTLLVHGQVTAK